MLAQVYVHTYLIQNQLNNCVQINIRLYIQSPDIITDKKMGARGLQRKKNLEELITRRVIGR